MSCTEKDAEIKGKESASSKGELWAFCLVQPGATKGIWLCLYITQAPKMPRSYLGTCTMLFQRRTGAKRPLIKWNWKLGGKRSGDEDPQMCVRGSREKKRWCSAIVCPFTALQGFQDTRIKQAFVYNWLKKNKNPCVRCFVPNQCNKSWLSPDSTAGCAALPGRHTDACKRSRGTRHSASSGGWNSPYHSSNTAERNRSKISTTSPRRNLGKKWRISQIHFLTLTPI